MKWKKLLKGVGLGGLAAVKYTPFAGIANALESTFKEQGLLKDPAAETKAKAILMEFERDIIKADSDRLETIGATMRAEAKSEHWPQYSWRPAVGFSFAAITGALGFAFAYLILRIALGYGFEKDTISNLVQVMQAMAPLFVVLGGVLGVTAWKRGDEKVARIKKGEK